MPEGAFATVTDADHIRCGLCPHACSIAIGEKGGCRVRENRNGRLELPFWGRLSALALDPMEKKPLYHFLPGAKVFSAGFFGCNLRCPFCQNWEISQRLDETAPRYSPRALVDAALASGAPALAFTYSEPLIHIEYLIEASGAAHQAGLHTVLVTNGMANEAAARELLPLIDATNVDLKCWSRADYAQKLGGNLKATLRFIELAAALSFVEVTTLLVPGLSADRETIEGVAGFIASIDRGIPLHLSAYHPAFQAHEAPTDPALLLDLAEFARKNLDYVYPGNIAGLASDTRCKSCGSLLVRRIGYRVESAGLIPVHASSRQLARAHCTECGSETAILLPTEVP